MPEFTRLQLNDLPAFLRKHRLSGGRVRRVRLLYPRPREATVEFHLTVREIAKSATPEAKPVRLVLRLEGVEEFRIQMRPKMPRMRIEDARIAYLNGLYFVNLDAWGLEPGEQPRLHDFRASETYAAGRELAWAEITPK